MKRFTPLLSIALLWACMPSTTHAQDLTYGPYQEKAEYVKRGHCQPASTATTRATTNAETAFLGMYYSPFGSYSTPDAEPAAGAIVTKVFGGSAADQGGLEEGDVVLAIDGYEISSDQGLAQIIRTYYQPCDEVEVTYEREGKKYYTTTTLTKRPEGNDYLHADPKGTFLGVYSKSTCGDANPATGAGVSKVIPNSTAAAMGMQNGDRIVKFNDEDITNWGDMVAAVDQSVAGAPLEVQVVRGEETVTLNGTMKTKGDVWYHLECENNVEDATEEELEDLAKATDIPTTKDNLGIGSVNFFPNPSNGEFDLTFNLYDEGDVSIRIFDAKGNEVYNQQIDGFSGMFYGNVDISENARGIYYLIVEQNDKAVTKKVVVD